jgi:hypothetical protein
VTSPDRAIEPVSGHPMPGFDSIQTHTSRLVVLLAEIETLVDVVAL